MIFNGKKKQNAVERYENLQGSFNTLSKRVVQESADLLNIRSSTAHKVFLELETLFSNIQDLPKEYLLALEKFVESEKKLSEIISLTTEQFSEVNISDYNESNTNIFSVENISVGAGVATGAGVVAFGPTAAVAVATTFGTASTGVAISSLTGAASTTAALAWLGGGTIAAGGSGMAGGYALLSLAGPVGCAIAGTSLAVFAMNSAHSDAIRINKTADHIFNVNKELLLSLDGIQNLKVEIIENISSINSLFIVIRNSLTSMYYDNFNEIQKNILILLKENIETLAELMIREVA